jgi:hypothetical protein
MPLGASHRPSLVRHRSIYISGKYVADHVYRASAAESRIADSEQSASTVEWRWQIPPPVCRDSSSAAAGAITRLGWSEEMPATSKGLSDEKAARILAGLQGGKTPRLLWITPERLKAYCGDHPEYGREALPLIEKNAAAALLRKGARLRNRTHCRYGHPLSGENLFVAPEGWRRCRICTDKSHAENRKVSEQQARNVVEALQEGKTIADITAGGKPTYLINNRALLLFRRKNPKFDRVVVRLSTANAKIHFVDAMARRAQLHRAPAIAEPEQTSSASFGLLCRTPCRPKFVTM